MCQRVRKVEYLKKVGEVRHGFAQGFIWECENEVSCEIAMAEFLDHPSPKALLKKGKILHAQISGRWKEYKIFV